MEGFFSTGQSPQRAVVPMDEEEKCNVVNCSVWSWFYDTLFSYKKYLGGGVGLLYIIKFYSELVLKTCRLSS
jgi:hypothetical protein